MSSQITGSLLTTFVLGMISTTAYFIVLTTVGCTSLYISSSLLLHVSSAARSIKSAHRRERGINSADSNQKSDSHAQKS